MEWRAWKPEAVSEDTGGGVQTAASRGVFPDRPSMPPRHPPSCDLHILDPQGLFSRELNRSVSFLLSPRQLLTWSRALVLFLQLTHDLPASRPPPPLSGPSPPPRIMFASDFRAERKSPQETAAVSSAPSAKHHVGGSRNQLGVHPQRAWAYSDGGSMQ